MEGELFMNVREISDCMREVPREQRIANRRRFLFIAIIVGCIALFGTIGSVILQQQKRESCEVSCLRTLFVDM